MEVDQHLIWLLGAIKACISDGDDVDDKNLNRNISDCMARVRSACSNGNKEQVLEDFKLKTTLVLLLCSPAVQALPLVQSSRDFQSVLLTFPKLKESVFFSVVRNQKLYRFLYPLLWCLPPSTLCKLIEEYFKCTNEVTPVTIAITLELLKALVSSLQDDSEVKDINKESLEVFSLALKFLGSKKVIGGSSAQVKSSAYFFLYFCECTYILISSFLGKYTGQPIYKFSQVWNDLWKVDSKSGAGRKVNIDIEILKSLLQMSQENIRAVTIDIWMEWSEVTLPASVTVHRRSVASQMKPQETTVQSVICNIAFDILRLVEQHLGFRDLFYECKDLVQFFEQVAADPDYDPDHDLTREQLFAEINLKDWRHQKLLGILVKMEDIFTSEECINCVSIHAEAFDTDVRLEILVKLIRHLKEGKECNSKSIEVVVKMAEDLPAESLLSIVDKDLSSGQDEILKTADFPQQMTAVFNQLADSSSSKKSMKHVWLCLQSGQTVVNEAVRLPIAFPGLVNVMVQALVAIPQVCQASGKSGVPVLIGALRDRQLAGLHGSEEKDFSDLVKGLLKATIVNEMDVLHLLVQPFLKFCQNDLTSLHLPIDLLQSVIHHDIKALVKPGAELVSLMLTLIQIIDVTSALNDDNVLVNLELRTDTLHIVQAITQAMLTHRENYEREICMLKQTIVKYNLHPRSVLPLRELLDCSDRLDTYEDCLLHLMSKMQLQQTSGKYVTVKDAINIPEKLSRASKEEWITMLLQLLPHCSEEEWIYAFFITHRYLQSGCMAMRTMMIFERILYLADLQSKAVDNDGNHSSVCVEHCFRCFTNASMVYLNQLMAALPSPKRFSSLCSIFRWWCQVRPLYPSELEVPSLFLLQLITAVEEMLSSDTLVLLEELQLNPPVNGKRRKSKAKRKVKGNVLISGGTQDEVKQVNGEVKDVENSDSVEDKSNGELISGVEKLHVDQHGNGEVRGTEGKLSETAITVAVNGIRSNQSSHSNKSDYSNQSGIEAISSEGKVPTDFLSTRSMRTRLNNEISREYFKKQILQVTLSFLKFIPPSNLTSSVAGKLKKLNEII